MTIDGESRRRDPVTGVLFLSAGLAYPKGLLVLEQAGVRVEMRLDARHAKVLIALWQARERDASWPEAIRGWRRPEHLKLSLPGGLPEPLPIDADTVGTYVKQIRSDLRRVRKQAAGDPAGFVLFERDKDLGLRLALERLTIIAGEDVERDVEALEGCNGPGF